MECLTTFSAKLITHLNGSPHTTGDEVKAMCRSRQVITDEEVPLADGIRLITSGLIWSNEYELHKQKSSNERKPNNRESE
ncbi:MAG: hypothetical protein A2Y88_11815 [Chloroflexi bacterium RBG_13_48_10]|nr:MAG: hypothetical protein A2Y88_11815 [Chloroflexi bacterium RBG_13_48_10]